MEIAVVCEVASLAKHGKPCIGVFRVVIEVRCCKIDGVGALVGLANVNIAVLCAASLTAPPCKLFALSRDLSPIRGIALFLPWHACRSTFVFAQYIAYEITILHQRVSMVQMFFIAILCNNWDYALFVILAIFTRFDRYT